MRSAFAVVMLLSVTAGLLAQERTLREMVQERNAPIEKRSSGNMPPVSMEQLVDEADLIVVGTVGDTTSYVSPDGKDVYTDLVLENVNFVYPASAGVTSRPGLVPKVVVTQLGGVVTISGHQVRSTHADLLPLQSGTRALFLLVRSEDRLFIARRYLGVFAPQANDVRPLATVEWFAEQYRGKVWEDFVREVESRAAQRVR